MAFYITMGRRCAPRDKQLVESWGTGCAPVENSPMTSFPIGPGCQYKVLLYQPPFGRKFNVNLWNKIPASRLGMPMGLNVVQIELPTPTLLFDLHQSLILHRLATIHNTGSESNVKVEKNSSVGLLQ